MSKIVVLYLPVTLHAWQYYFLVYPVLEEGISYALAMLIYREQVLHLPVTLHTYEYCLLVYLIPREVFSYTCI